LDELKTLKEAVIVMENRLRDCQTNNNEGQTMKLIIKHFKRILRELETINPYQYDGLVMQVLGGF
jgi:adenylyl- and sulfurtransferase ThiI